MKFLSLFTGLGLMDLAFESEGFECIGQVEIDADCRRFLEWRWPDVPRVKDVNEVTAKTFVPPDLIIAGPPCQPASAAGLRRGTDDDRWLWAEALRIVKALRPAWALLENPVGLSHVVESRDPVTVESRISRRTPDGDFFSGVYTRAEDMYFGTLVQTLEEADYQVSVLNIPACSLQAAHERQRFWIVAHADRDGQRQSQDKADAGRAERRTRKSDSGIVGAGSLAQPPRQRNHGTGDTGQRRGTEHTDGSVGDAAIVRGAEVQRSGTNGEVSGNGLVDSQGTDGRTDGRACRPEREQRLQQDRAESHNRNERSAEIEWLAGWDGKHRRIPQGLFAAARMLADGGVPELPFRFDGRRSPYTPLLRGIGNGVAVPTVRALARAMMEAS